MNANRKTDKLAPTLLDTLHEVADPKFKRTTRNRWDGFDALLERGLVFRTFSRDENSAIVRANIVVTDAGYAALEAAGRVVSRTARAEYEEELRRYHANRIAEGLREEQLAAEGGV